MTPTPKSYINAQLNLNKTVIIISDMPKHKKQSSLKNLRSKSLIMLLLGQYMGSLSIQQTELILVYLENIITFLIVVRFSKFKVCHSAENTAKSVFKKLGSVPKNWDHLGSSKHGIYSVTP